MLEHLPGRAWRRRSRILLSFLFAFLLLPPPGLAAGPEPFAIQVVDEETGRGVPLVELRTTNGIRLFTDSNGIAAFSEPGLMDQEIFFHLKSHGYEFPKDGFGYRGRALQVRAGGRARLAIRRRNIAERLYRVVGAGIYRDSVLVGEPVPLKEPLLNAQVAGSDSVLSALYRGKIYWFWGDTNRPRYPLGNFHTPGATSELPARGGLDPDRGIDLKYFVGEDGFARPTAKLPGEGPTWISGLVVLTAQGGERMFAHYVKVRGGAAGAFDVYERGLVEFNDQKKAFEKVAAFPLPEPFPGGAHPFIHEEGGKSYVYYADPYPLIRVAADPEELGRQERYEAFTCRVAGTQDGPLELDGLGTPRWGWKAGTAPLRPERAAELLRSGKLRGEDNPLALRDADTGKSVIAQRGSVYWNDHRRRWVMIACEIYGTSLLGETWYAEADRPLGPWVYARKVVTHDDYSFYNPKHHPMLDKEGGRLIYFEGTYTATFSGNRDPTPRYDYNQVLYRLDLSDPRLNLPVAVYRAGSIEEPGGFRTAREPGATAGAIAFWALERPGAGTLPVRALRTAQGALALEVGGAGEASEESAARAPEPLFHVLPAQAADPPAATVLLYEFLEAGGRRRAYAIEPDPKTLPAAFERPPRPLGRVWPHPLGPRLPGGR